MIGFDETHEFFDSAVSYIEEPYRIEVDLTGPGFGSPRDVEYADDRVAINLGDSVPFSYFFVKSRAWAYEREVRVFRRLSDGVARNASNSSMRFIAFPGPAVRVVIAGADCSCHAELRAILAKDRYNHVVLVKAEIDARKFQLRIPGIAA